VKDHFFTLADRLFRELGAGETLLCSLSAERSDFVRFNRARVRQAGTVNLLDGDRRPLRLDTATELGHLTRAGKIVRHYRSS